MALATIFTISLYLSLLIKIIVAADYIPRDHILLNCGASELKSTDSEKREWRSDKLLISSKDSFRASLPDVDKVPYMSARIFLSNSTYSFPVSPGRVFLRLYFYPNIHYSRSNAVFSVTAGSFTLLRNFNFTQKLDVDFLIKEYYINVDESEMLMVTFIPWHKSFAFVNGIEVLSIPNIYDNNDVGDNIVGASSPFQIDNSTVLQTLYRLNMGGNYIAPSEDTGLFRSWSVDSGYLFGSESGVKTVGDREVSIRYTKSIPSYTAPMDVYSTARFMTPDSFNNLKFNLTWLFPIDTRFAYMVRLHFCQFLSNMDKVNQIVFNLYLNNITAFSGVDVVALTNSIGVPYIMDFVVIIPTTEDPFQDLWLALHPDTTDKPQYYNAFLNGLEIFKINNTDATLAI